MIDMRSKNEYSDIIKIDINLSFNNSKRKESAYFIEFKTYFFFLVI